MADWEIFDGTTINGPFSEQAMVDTIRRGMPATILIRRVGTEDWKGLRSHPPFAMALEAATVAQSAAIPPQPQPTQPAPTVVVSSNPATEGCFTVLWIIFGTGLVLFLATCAICSSAGR
jgi:hypothetical protein